MGLDGKEPGKGSMLPPRGPGQPEQQGISHVVLSEPQGSPVPTQPRESCTNFIYYSVTLRAWESGLGSRVKANVGHYVKLSSHTSLPSFE